MGKRILAVLAGAAVWAVLWIGGTQAAQSAFPDLLRPGQPLTHAGALASYIIYSAVLSMLAGYVTALVAGKDPMPAVWGLAALQLALGIAFGSIRMEPYARLVPPGVPGSHRSGNGLWRIDLR